MILSRKVLDEIIADASSEIQGLGTFKSRGKGRKYTAYERNILAMDTYTIIICKLCIRLIKDKEYSVNRVSNYLRTFDWNYYSLSSKALSSEEVAELFGEKKSTPAWELLSYQSYWLQRAGNHVADMLDCEVDKND